ncbi:MAG: class I SAM-dependent methyltransferase [Planctomycetia bacterium]|nr:class I SAM-dependent methyltransferase [Planctomycetia bacterium]
MTSLLPAYCTSLLNRCSDFGWESWLRVQTTRSAPSPHRDAHRYGYLAFHTYFSIFDHLALTANDTVVDLGCGKGRVVCVAAQYRIREAIGVEIDSMLAAQAVSNAERMRRRRSPLRIVCESATAFDYSTTTVIVMFHPFGSDTMNEVLDRLHDSLARNPRVVRIVYANPEYCSVLTARSWLKLEAGWSPTAWGRVKFPIHFYRTIVT